MIVVDVNVLVAAHIRCHRHHQLALPWLTEALGKLADPVVVPDLVWVGFARVATNPRIFIEPSTLPKAQAFMASVIEGPAYHPLPGLAAGLDRFWSACQAAEASSGLVTDAYIAAIALEYACPVATFDRDFRHFDGLTVITPGQI